MFDALDEIVDLFNLKLQGSKVKLKSEYRKEEQMFPSLVFDKKRLQQVLLNLLSFAIRAQTKGKVKICAYIHEVSFESCMLEVFVQD